MSSSAPAFVHGAVASTFTPRTVHSSVASLRPVPVVAPPARRAAVVALYASPQPGDPGAKLPPPVPKGTGMDKAPPPKKPKKDDDDDEPKASAGEKGKVTASKSKAAPATVTPGKAGKPAAGGFARKLPVTASIDAAKRGLDLLREDVLKTAPEAAGFGRQDKSAIMKPLPGEPGYKPAAYETIKVSELGISPFPEDANAVGKVGGIAAVKKAALEVKKGKKTADQVKKEVLKIETKAEQTVFDIPDYLKPLPEDTPRKGYTWKNYEGR